MAGFQSLTAVALGSLVLCSSAVAQPMAGMQASEDMEGSTCLFESTTNMTTACRWSPSSCTECAEQCIINPAYLALNTTGTDDVVRGMYENIEACAAAGSLATFAAIAAAFDGAMTSRKLVSADGMAVKKAIAAARKVGKAAKAGTIAPSASADTPRRALQQAATLSLECPNDKTMDDLAAMLTDSDDTESMDDSDDDYDNEFLNGLLSDAAMFKAYVKANCSTINIDSSAVVELDLGELLGGSGAVPFNVDELPDKVKLCSDKAGRFQKSLKREMDCDQSKLYNVTNRYCIDEAQSVYFTETCLKTTLDLLDLPTTPAAAFSRNAIDIHADCQTRNEAMCEDPAGDAVIDAKVSAFKTAKTGIEKSASDLSTSAAQSLPMLSAAAVVLGAFALF